MLKQRIITGLVLVPVALLVIFLLPVRMFSLIMWIGIVVASWEWSGLSGRKYSNEHYVYASFLGMLALFSFLAIPSWIILSMGLLWWLIAFFLVISYPSSQRYIKTTAIRLLIGPIVLVPTWHALVLIKQSADANAWLALVFFTVWLMDSGAYFAGKRFGKTPLASKVSPNKTVEGIVGGLLVIMLLLLVVCLWMQLGFIEVLQLFALVIVIAMASVLGDLWESVLKRMCGAKDSGSLLPGHGGILDRIDSLTAALPVCAFILLVAERI